MNEVLILFIIAMALTISHVWQKSILLLIITSVIWAAFIGHIIFTEHEATSFSWDIWVVKLAEFSGSFPLLLAYLIMKFVERSPLWKPLVYPDFKVAASQLPHGDSIRYFVNTLLGLSITGLLIVGILQLL